MHHHLMISALAVLLAAPSLPIRAEVPTAMADAAPAPKLAYQGRLMEGGNPVTGTRSFAFAILDASNAELWNSGAQSLAVAGGLYSMTLGAPGMPPLPAALLAKADLKLRVSVGGVAMTPDVDLVPAMQSRSAWDFAGGLSGDVSGTQFATSVERIKGIAVDLSIAPINGQVLAFNGSSWVASNVPSGMGPKGDPGPKGDAGPKGDPGPKGDAGPPGSGSVTRVSASTPLSVANPTTTPTLSLGVVPFANGGTGTTGFHTGAIPFSNGSALTSDFASLFWDAGNKRLGLGTTAPDAQLTLTGNIDLAYGPAPGASIMMAGANFLTAWRNNIFIGSLAGSYSNTGNIGNIAIGNQSLSNGIAPQSNLAIGNSSLLACNGLYNIGIGDSAGGSINGGTNNLIIGRGTGYNIVNGNGNIIIGNGVAGSADENDTIRIGLSQLSGKCFVGNIRSVTTIHNDAIPVVIDSSGQLGTISSSRRFKDDIRDMGDASSRIFDLRPVTFRYKGQESSHFGLIAEEVQEILPELAVMGRDGQVETVAYHELPPLLLNELQKQRARIQALEAELAEIKALVLSQARH